MNNQEQQHKPHGSGGERGERRIDRQADQSEDRRARILSAAKKLLAEEGYDRVTMKQVAREAGVAQGLIHYYFSGKGDLLLAVLRETLDEYAREHRAMMKGLLESPPDSTEGVGLMEAALALPKGRISRTPERYRLHYELFAMGLRDPEFRPGVASFLEQGRRSIGEALKSMNGAGTDAETSESERKALAAVILACFEGFALQKLADPEGFDLDAAYGVLAKMAEGMIGSEEG